MIKLKNKKAAAWGLKKTISIVLGILCLLFLVLLFYLIYSTYIQQSEREKAESVLNLILDKLDALEENETAKIIVTNPETWKFITFSEFPRPSSCKSTEDDDVCFCLCSAVSKENDNDKNVKYCNKLGVCVVPELEPKLVGIENEGKDIKGNYYWKQPNERYFKPLLDENIRKYKLEKGLIKVKSLGVLYFYISETSGTVTPRKFVIERKKERFNFWRENDFYLYNSSINFFGSKSKFLDYGEISIEEQIFKAYLYNLVYAVDENEKKEVKKNIENYFKDMPLKVKVIIATENIWDIRGYKDLYSDYGYKDKVWLSILVGEGSDNFKPLHYIEKEIAVPEGSPLHAVVLFLDGEEVK